MKGVEVRFIFLFPQSRHLQSFGAGLTSMSIGMYDSFLPHLGHFPSLAWMISSGGFNSSPSYRM
jgi:hypothetical protein